MIMEHTLRFARLAEIPLSPSQFSGVLTANVSEYDLAKFAELTINECCAKLLAMDEKAGNNHNYYRHAAIEIKRHFGVDDGLKIGDTIKVVAGFNVGASGVINYIDPTGKIWVRRKGADSDVFYYIYELKKIGGGNHD